MPVFRDNELDNLADQVKERICDWVLADSIGKVDKEPLMSQKVKKFRYLSQFINTMVYSLLIIFQKDLFDFIRYLISNLSHTFYKHLYKLRAWENTLVGHQKVSALDKELHESSQVRIKQAFHLFLVQLRQVAWKQLRKHAVFEVCVVAQVLFRK